MPRTRSRRVWIGFLLAAVVLPLGWLFLGIFRDREWDELYLFVKHRPSLQLYFHAPCGESDQPLGALPESQRRAELLYRELVEEGGGWRRSLYLPRL